MLDTIKEVGTLVGLLGGGFAGAVFGVDRTLKALRMVGKAPGWYERVWSEKAQERVDQDARDKALRQLIDHSALILHAVTRNGGGSFRDDFDEHCRVSVVAHEKIADSIETVFEMIGTSHDEIANLGRSVARQALWQTKHDELTARQTGRQPA